MRVFATPESNAWPGLLWVTSHARPPGLPTNLENPHRHDATNYGTTEMALMIHQCAEVRSTHLSSSSALAWASPNAL